MADAIAILKLIYKAFNKIKKVAKTLDQNDEDVRSIGQLVDCWSQILSPLEKKRAMLENPGIRYAVSYLWETLERAQVQILADTDTNRVSLVYNAEGKANKLRRLREEISEKVSMVTGAMTAYNATCAEESRQHAPSSEVFRTLIDIQSTEVSEEPFQLYRITRGTSNNSIRSVRCKDNKLLDIYPLELRFPFEPNKEIQLPVTLTNRTDHYVGVWITQICPQEQFTCPSSNTIDPYSSLAMSVTMKEHRQQPQRSTCKFEVLVVLVWLKVHFENLTSIIDGKLNMNRQGVTPQLIHILEQAGKLHGEVYRAMFTAVICDKPKCPIISIPTKDMAIISIDVHPTKPWILMSHEGGDISIWNYQTQDRMKTFRVKTEQENSSFSFIPRVRSCPYTFPHWVYSTKLIARKCFLALGFGSGNVHVYELSNNGTTVRKLKKIPAYNGKPVDTLAVHPSKSYLLSSSTFHGKVKLWDWDQNWVKIREFDGNNGGVRSLTFNPSDTATFACVTFNRNEKVFGLGEGVVDEESTNLQVWNINDKSSSHTITFPGLHSAEFLCTQSPQHYLVTPGSSKHCIFERTTASRTKIWDLQKKEVAHTFCLSGNSKTSGVACHPTFPILVTTSDDGTVCLWDTRTYRLEKMIHSKYNSPKEALVFTADTDSGTRLVVGFKSTIEIMRVEIHECQGSTSGLVVGAISEMP